jgi:hypothetical protein
MPFRDRFGDLLLKWVCRFGHREVFVKDLEELFMDEVFEDMVDGGGMTNSESSIGLYLHHHKDRTVGSYRLVRAGSTHGHTRWRVENTIPPVGDLNAIEEEEEGT